MTPLPWPAALQWLESQAALDGAGLDALQPQGARWLPVLTALAQRHTTAPLEAAGTSTVLVALAPEMVLKAYPPFLRDHGRFECTALKHLHGRLPVPTPRLLGQGEHAGWRWLVMSRLPGRPLDGLWDTLPEAERLALVRRVGEVAAALHALPVGPLREAAPAWPAFVQQQRQRCHARQQRTGLPPQLLAGLEDFLQGPVPQAHSRQAGSLHVDSLHANSPHANAQQGADVILTGEFTPFNLLVDANAQLLGMIDFGDGLVGPREYDWLGPMCFYAAGQPARLDAFFAGYGVPTPRGRCQELLRLLLLHRYSCLPAQLQGLPGWQQSPDLPALARLAWG